jgi:hypothetical protein
MNLSGIPPPFGSPMSPPTYPMSCVKWGQDEHLAVAVVAGTTWGLLVALLGISLYHRISNKPSLIKYNRRILTNMVESSGRPVGHAIPEEQSMETA